jgi:hypothetical protein
LCQTTDQIAKSEEDVGKDQAPATRVDIGQSAAEGLAGGIRDQVRCS